MAAVRRVGHGARASERAFAQAVALGGDRDRVQARQRLLQRTAAAVVQAVDRVLGLAEALGDLAGRVAGHVAQDDDVALDLRELLEGGGQSLRELAAAVLGTLVDRAGLFAE